MASAYSVSLRMLLSREVELVWLLSPSSSVILAVPLLLVKEEPHDEEEPLPARKPSLAKAPPPFPQDMSMAELLQKLSFSKEDELLFLQLPDTLPGQPPTQDTKPIKTEVQNEDGQMMLIKQEKSQVCD